VDVKPKVAPGASVVSYGAVTPETLAVSRPFMAIFSNM
jgi:hypothetical protein